MSQEAAGSSAGRGGEGLQQASEIPSGSTASSLAPTARPLQPNPQAQIAVVLIHGLNSSESAFIGQDGTSWATELNKEIAPLIEGQQVEVFQVGWQTTPTTTANTSLNITDTTPDLLDAIVRVVQGRTWVAVGHSMGGMEILAAMGTAFAETTQTGGNPRTSDPQRLKDWGGLLNTCLGIFRLASPGQGSPWGQFGLVIANLVPFANPNQIRGLVVESAESKAITASSNLWFESRMKAGRAVNVFSAQETQPVVPATGKIVDYDGSAFAASSSSLTNNKAVLLPGESHTSAPKAPVGSPTANILVSGVVFCITGRVPAGVQLTPGRVKPSGISGKINKLLPSGSTLRNMLPGKSRSGSGSGAGAGGSSSGQNPPPAGQ